MPKRILSGTICKATNRKTVVVEVERTFKHPIYKKYIKRSKKYHAHDETDALRVGEKVMIEETRPISKLKTCNRKQFCMNSLNETSNQFLSRAEQQHSTLLLKVIFGLKHA